MKKAIKIVTAVILMLISNFAILANTVQAVGNGQVSVYTTGNLSRMLRYDGMLIKTANAVYEENGNQYPAYCLNKDLKGVGETLLTYETIVQEKITDVGLWRVIINGYPYKSLEELGVASYDEAYTATKQAIYCHIYNRTTEKYTGVGESGQRVVNAMNIILTNARQTTENPGENQITIEQNEKWQVDSKNKNYISKEYQIKSNTNISQYSIELEGAPEDTIITDLENNVKQTFSSNEKFKILIPILKLQESGNFKINIKTQMETKPIFYGKAPSSELQDYALTAFRYENIDTELMQEYSKNDTKIIVEKEDEETHEKIKGAVFEILDENQKLITTETTNENGIIELKSILPGTYYIKEIKAPDGYEINEQLTKIEIQLNEQKEVVIGNKKIEIIEIKEEPEILEEPEVVEEVRKLPVTGM